MFDKDNDGYLSVSELRKIMLTMGKRMKKSEVEEMVTEADIAKNGLINLKGDSHLNLGSFIVLSFVIVDFCSLLIYGTVKAKAKKTIKNPKRRVQESCKDNYSSRSGSFSQG